jgi:AcrR family transcriptional regulator
VANKIAAEEQPKREAILVASRTLFTENNYEDVTIADIAKKAGVAVGTVYLYFRNKRDVYTAVALDLEERMAAIFYDPSLLERPFAETLPEIVDSIFNFNHENEQLMGLLHVEIRSDEESKQHKDVDERISAAIATIFEHAIARGELAPFDTRIYAQILNQMGGSLLHQCFVVEQGEQEEQYAIAFVDLLQRLFFGPPLKTPAPESNR